MKSQIPAGVSIVVCCHNSARRLPPTIAHLAAQVVNGNVPWEVVVVDNASTDDTGQVARDLWPATCDAPLRGVSEPHPGLINARHRGFAEASYDVVTFVDDDNWVCPEWVQTMADVMAQNPGIGACGGASEAVCEGAPPWWFADFAASYAVGTQGSESGDVTWSRGYLWGAGLTIRKQAWQQLMESGFRPLLVGRKGASLTSGDDSELCLALRLAGWRLYYCSRLRLRHFLPVRRLEWGYLRRLHRAFGVSSVGLDPYTFAADRNGTGLQEQDVQTWRRQTRYALENLFEKRATLLASLREPLEGDGDVLFVERKLGRLFELWRRRKVYVREIEATRNAAWNRIS